MATEVLMPKLGLTMTEGTIEEWKFKEGDTVKKGDILFSVATDKLTNDVEAEEDGTLLKILLPEWRDRPLQERDRLDRRRRRGGSRCFAGAAAPAAPAPAAPAAPALAAAPAAAGQKTVIVVGGGPGGYVVAIRAAQLGAKVTPGGARAHRRHLPEHRSHPHQVLAAQRGAGVRDQGTGC